MPTGNLDSQARKSSNSFAFTARENGTTLSRDTICRSLYAPRLFTWSTAKIDSTERPRADLHLNEQEVKISGVDREVMKTEMKVPTAWVASNAFNQQLLWCPRW